MNTFCVVAAFGSDVIQTATSISKPLSLAGLLAAILFLVIRQIISRNIIPSLDPEQGGKVVIKILNYLFVLALVAMILGTAAYIYVASRSRPPETTESASIDLVSGTTFEGAVRMIVESESRSVSFDGCLQDALSTKLSAGTISGKTSKDLLEDLRYHVSDPSKPLKYKVTYLPDRGVYEIHCDN